MRFFCCFHVDIFNIHYKQHKETLNLMTKVMTEWFTNVFEVFQGNRLSNTSYTSFICARWFSGCSAKMHHWTGGSAWPLGINSVFDSKTVVSKVNRGGFEISMRFKLLFFFGLVWGFGVGFFWVWRVFFVFVFLLLLFNWAFLFFSIVIHLYCD